MLAVRFCLDNITHPVKFKPTSFSTIWEVYCNYYESNLMYQGPQHDPTFRQLQGYFLLLIAISCMHAVILLVV
jgi:hypothetical protein